jgi:hypothetical protein
MTVDMKDMLNTTFRYFSHNIRTATSTIVAMLEVVKDELGEDNDEMFHYVTESGFLLDLFDKGFSTCLQYVVCGEIESLNDDIELERLVDSFFHEVTLANEVGDFELVKKIDSGFVVKDTAYIFKTIFQIMLYEASKIHSGSIEIVASGNEIRVTCDDLFPEHKIMEQVVTNLYKEINIDFKYIDKTIVMGIS